MAAGIDHTAVRYYRTMMQFREGLTDRQAADDAVRSRIDWKYLLGLKLNDPGFHYSVLCEFRTRLIEGGAEETLFEAILELCRERGILKERGKQRTDSTYIVDAVQSCLKLALQLALIWVPVQLVLHTAQTSNSFASVV